MSARASRRIGTALFAALFLIAYFAGAIHEAATLHATCADHGERIDVSSVGKDACAAGAQGACTSDAPAPRLRPARPFAPDDHGHCSFDPFAQPTTESLRAPTFVAWLGEAPRLDAPPRVALAIDDSLYLLAPKQSPPADPGAGI